VICTSFSNGRRHDFRLFKDHDGSVTEMYFYPYCQPEEKTTWEENHKFSDYFSSHMQCTNINFGMDGTNGQTWIYDDA